jgi:hypothetical protein
MRGGDRPSLAAVTGEAAAANRARSRVTSHLYRAQGSAATEFCCANANGAGEISGAAHINEAVAKDSNRIVQSP